MLYNEEIELDEDFEGVDDSEAEVVTEFDEIDENTDYDNNYTYVDIDFQQDTPQLIDTPTPVVDPVVEETELIPDPEFETVTETYEMILQEYSQEYLQALEDDGYTFYVIYEDGTEDEVDISEIEEPTTSIEFLDDEAYVLANSILEHFWDDDSGVHVTQDTKEAWAQLVEDNFPDLDATHPHHNIIVNSYGVLIRSALKNLVQLSRSALAFYDGLGNNSSNIISTFGRGGIQIGPTDQKHLIINNNGITVYNGDGTIAPLTASNIAAIEANIQTLTAADATITGRLTAAEGNITTLTSSKANVTDLTAATARIDILEGDHVTVSDFQAEQAKISALQADHVTVSDFEAEQANIDNLQTATADIATIRANSAKVANLTAQQLEADHATVGSLSTNYAHISNGVIDNAKIDQADVNNLSANYAHIANGIIDNATIDKAKVNGLSATYATIESLNTANARITDLEADHVSVDDFEADHAVIESLDSNYAHITNGVIDNAKIGHADVNGLSANYAHVSNGVIDNAKIDQANVNNLSANYAHIANGVIDNAKISYADVNGLSANYAQVNMANVNNAWIQNGTVKDGAITNAMINSVSANKLTAGTIDASSITVTNLNADNITTGTINGQRIGAGSLSLDKLEDEVYTETEVDSIVSNLQTQIDGAIETWTGTDVPTLNNAPASSWNTNSIKDTHVGDVYFVVNSQSQQNGYNYRFTKTTSGGTSTYSWQLIKDNDVTNALQRLTTAEGKIGTIEQFDSTVSSFMTNTDNELTSIKSAATTLSGRVDTAEGTLATKVDTTTFNSLSQTVEGHSSSITQLTTETTTLTQAVDTLNTKTSSDSGNIVQFSDSIGFKEIVVHGKSTQVTTTGKNLLDLSNRTIVKLPLFSNTTSREMDESYVYDGITLSNYGGPDNVTFTEFDGTYTVTAASSGYGVGLPSPVMPNTSYCASSSGIIGVGFYDADGVFLSGAGGSSTTVAFVTPSGCEWVMLILRPPANVATKYTNIQLELGSTATSYEPYTGGKPAPNPDYPQEIKSVDDLTLHICGKNLFDPSHLLEASNWTVSNGVYTGWGSALHTSFVNGYPLPPFVANTRYTLSFDFDYDGDNGIALVVNFAHADGTQDVRYVNAKNSHQVLTSSAGRTLTAIGLSYGTNRVIRLSNIQVEQASTATDYEPYQGQSVDIPLGDHQIRSLPDGTDDTLTFSYIGPSIREGWGLYNAELMQNVTVETITDQLGWTKSTAYSGGYYRPGWAGIRSIASSPNHIQNRFITATNLSKYVAGTCYLDNSLNFRFDNEDVSTVYDFKAWLSNNPVDIQYPLVTPITHSLGVVELPLSEDLNLWATTSPSTTIDATWWHEPGRVEKNEIDISLTASNLENSINSTTLPAPYTEVEWVESNGAQYVYLDWKPPIATWGFEADFIIRNAFSTSVGAWNPNTNANGYGNVFGTRNASGINDIQLGTYSTNGTEGTLRWGQAGYTSPGLFKTDKTRQQVSLKGTTLTKADGTTATIIRSTENASKFYANMAVFCMHEGLRRGGTGGIVQPGSVRIYSLKFYDGDELKVDLVGAIRNRDGITGLYDKVKDHFYPAYGMTYGEAVGDLGTPDTILEAVAKSKINVHIDNRQISRMWRAEVPELNRLEDGQTISVTFSTNIGSTTPAAAGLVGWDETATTAYSNVFLKLVLADETETEWIPCFYAQGTRLTSHYGSGTPILLTYRENVLYGASTTNAGTSVMRAWYADPNYVDGNTQYTKYSNSVIAGLNGIKRYSLCMKDQNGKWTSIINQANTVAATKTCYTGGLQLDTILYYNPANEIAAGNSSSDGLWESFGIIDWRYSFNVENNATNGLTYRTPLYLVGTLSNSDGLFYLDTTKWWTQEPNDPAKIYIWVSAGYTDYYQGILSVQNTVYAYDEDSGLIEINVSRYSKTTTKLNQTIDTVNEHTRKIGVLETTVENKADGSDVETISNTLNTVSQTATSNSQKITNLTTRLGTNADGTAGVNDIIAKESALEQDLDGFKTTVSSTYTTKTEFNGLELGGRNYALNSEFICDRSLHGGNEYFAYDLGRALPFGEGTPIVISFDLYMEVVTSRADLFIVYNSNNKGPHEVIVDTRPFQGRTVSAGDVINERVVIVRTVRRDRTDANKDHDWLEFYTGYGSGNLFKITNLKLEKGTKVTDWTPAPEEQNNYGLEISGRNLIRNSTSVKMGGSDLNSQTAAANIPMYRWAYSTSNGVHTYTFTEDSNGIRTLNNAYTNLASYIIPGIVEMRNRDYSWALDVKIDGVENLGNNAYFVFDIDMRPSSTNGSHEVKIYANEMADGIWTHIGSSGIVGASDTGSLFEFGVYGLDTVTGSFTVSYRNPILVYGNKVPADWSPAPEDQATNADLTAVTTRVSAAESTIEQHSTSIALKANSSDVYTKTQTDGLISTEVTNRNAAITAATNAIELSVSETYASKKQLGSRNLVETTVITYGYLAINGGIQPAGATFKELTSDYIPVSSDKPMIFQYWVSVTGIGSGNGAGWMAYGFYDSNKSWLSSPGRFAKYSGLSNTPTTPVPWHGVYEINDIPSDAAYIRVSWRELTDGIVKLERRDDSDANIAYQVNEAKAAIKVTTDSISTEVSKKVGASEVISKINQSAESVKIQASKVEIDGTAIFNSISSNVDTSISNSISSAKLVKTTQDQWYSSTSATTKTGGSWATTQPSIIAGRYIWQRQYVTYSDNTTAYLPSEAGICTQGQTDLSGYSTTTQMNSAIGTAKQEALAVANSKRRIFTTTPTVPYDVGDLWVNGTSIRYASTSKTDSQTYSESDWTVTATDDTLAQSAVDVTHRIYYRTATANSSLTAPTTWVEEATSNVYNQWTTKVPPLAASTAVGQTKYLYLYTCEQRKRLDGTISCTKVLLDENTTVIDGGSIVTNSVTANQIAAGAITAEKLDATNINASNSLTIGALSTQTQSSILNSELSADIASAAKRTDVSIAVTAIDYAAGTATLQASLYIDGVVTTSGVTYQWLKDGTNISGQTSRTLSVTSAMGLSHVYSCTATY